MASTFYGLEIARSAVNANQVALDVTGQNIANINTDDYTRQSADLAAVNYGSGIYTIAQHANQAGQGVTVQQISQIRDSFLDTRVRNANSESNMWNTALSALSDIEEVLDESETDGLHAMLNDFYNSLQDLSNNVGKTEYASIVRSSAEKVVQIFNQYASQFSRIREDQVTSLEIDVKDINVNINKINEINDLIKDQTVRGSVSNELLDLRNSYLDTLSEYMPIAVEANDDGTVSVLSGGESVLDSTFSVTVSGDETSIQRTDSLGTVTAYSPEAGTLKGYLNILNGAGKLAETGESTYNGLLYYERSFDAFADAFAGTFNAINTLDPAVPANLFEGSTASDIRISDAWYEDAFFLVTSDQDSNDNIIKMINAMDNDVDTSLYPEITGTFEGFSRTMMGDIAIDTGYTEDMAGMNEDILDAVANQRESIMGVSLNDETINLTKFQRAYQAAARLMTVLDENLDTLINGMGVVGR